MVTLALVLALSPWGRATAVLGPPADPPPAEVGDPSASTEPDDDGRDDDSPLRSTLPDKERQAEASRAFFRGLRAFDEQRYEDALKNFTRAQKLAPHADTLFNLAVAQQATEDHVAAWMTFDQLLQDPEEKEREDILAQQAISRPHVAWLRVHTNSEGIVCLDGEPMPRDDEGVPSVLTTPGPHRLDVDRQHRPLELDGGEARTLELELLPARPPPPPRRALRVLTGLTIAGATAATGLGLSAGLVDDNQTRLGLGLGAAVAGALALTTSVTALAMHRRARHWRTPPPLQRCPP